VNNLIYDSPDVPSRAVLVLVEAADRAIREQVARLGREDALDALELLRERLLVMEQERL
jgi:hypothetical protein